MIVNKPEDGMYSNEYISGAAASEDMVSRLANELYKGDLAPQLVEELADGETFREDKQNMSLSQVGTQFSAPTMTNLSEPADFPYYYKMQTVSGKVGSAANTACSTDCVYYFMPEFKHAATQENVKIPYRPAMDVASIRKDFPILQRKVNGKPLVWLDNAATTQKPVHMINALNRYYNEYNSNVHRGAHTLAKLATNAYEAAREKIQRFIGAALPEEIIFVRGTTEAINLVAHSYGGMNIEAGDEILLTMMEHHSNIVPWQMLRQMKSAVLKPIPINERGEVILEEYEKLLSPRTRLVAITHVSNALGTINPVRIMAEMAHKHGAHVLIDGAQSVPHMRVDVKALDADFYAFSGHKIYGPTGIGVLYGKKALLEEMPPWQKGGGMIRNVSFEKTVYDNLPYKFEAGTGNIADAVALGASIDYIQKIGMENIEFHEKELTVYAMKELSRIPGLHLIGTALDKTSVISFIIDGKQPESIASRLNQEGMAVRAGHHCAQPVLQKFGLKSTVRASLGLYNTLEEVESFIRNVYKIATSNN